MKRILAVDSDLASRESIRATFWGLYEIQLAGSSTEALDSLRTCHFDLLIMEALMPGAGELTLLQEARQISPEIPLIIISAINHESLHRELKKLPSVGFISKPFSVLEFRNLVAQTLGASNSERQRVAFKSELYKEFPVNIIGESPEIQKAIEIAKQASQTGSPVIIQGESGTGRELLARQIHSWSQRSNEPFAKIECNRFDSKSINTEIFGEISRATGFEIKSGAFDLVGAGSILLNNAQLIPEDTRSRLFTTIEQKAFRRVGSPSEGVPCATRIFASCDSSPETVKETQRFAEEMDDLVELHIIRLPPLRERSQDIPLLTAHYLTQLRFDHTSRMNSIEPIALQRMQGYSWPGNVQELRNVLERIMVLHGEEETLRVEFLPREIGGNPLPYLDPCSISFNDATDQLHRQLITSALKMSNGKVKAAADMLRLTPRILQHRMDKLEIDACDFLISR